ncbi:hypothetical protein BO94DRAFT_570589 [Aspergillus sclerotioniger CBS 115572]|uniref:CBM-cenC domain-containing protein n=1 Tax=Aspergillus sclerotioniger CBS 115572 TaxID=1450535 RepID=A0A317XC80_9EURO|nr:hypothetical protein BO94DRAFT_570589 [Aspergillus sclerotioniger CBS 115572]PWY96244.1 hypothetical protein BO94DRAFT_570589 [Aspergillus sclerotioniger CBS 115572]
MLLPTTLVLTSCLFFPFVTAGTTVITGTTESCTTTAEFLTNPSFDTGSLSPWNAMTGFGSASVVEDTADNRGHVATLAEDQTMSAIYQTVTGLTVGASYTLSYDYMIKSAGMVGSAAFYICVDGIASANRLTLQGVTYTAAGTSWETISTTFTPTSDSHEFYILVYVVRSSTDPEILLDNAQFLAVSEEDDLETCTTSTYTTTVAVSTSSSSAISSIPAPASSSSAIATVSPTIPTSTPSHSSVVPAASSSPSRSLISSSGSVAASAPLVPVSASSRVIQSSPSSSLSSSSSLVQSLHSSSNVIRSSTMTPSKALASSSLLAVSRSISASTPVIRSSGGAKVNTPPAVSTPTSEPDEVVTVVSTVYTTLIATVLGCSASY